jgi:hypothetical protein
VKVGFQPIAGGPGRFFMQFVYFSRVLVSLGHGLRKSDAFLSKRVK